jgi:hypothetical protein
MISVAPIPDHLMQMMNDGGLIPHLKRRLDRNQADRGASL